MYGRGISQKGVVDRSLDFYSESLQLMFTQKNESSVTIYSPSCSFEAHMTFFVLRNTEVIDI